MKKLLLFSFICFLSIKSNAQFNYSYSDGGAPVVGMQYGIVGGGHTAMLSNTDDMNSELISPKAVNFVYFGGVECIRWYNPYFGVGGQATYWMAGGAYSGNLYKGDGAPTINATTSLTYAKIPLLFWYKSYSRWHPDRRLRLNTFFGPYVAMLLSGQEEWNIGVPGSDLNDRYVLKSGSFKGYTKDGVEFFDGKADDGKMFKPFDWGFTMGAGVELRLWHRTVIGLTVRADLGQAEVENKNFEVANSAGTRYKFYKDVTGKYIPYTSALGQDYDFNRPETRNATFGAQLSIRKYFGAR